ncbi:MAG: DUF1415 domain-containing protein [Bacteroidota bacterium]
MMPTETEIIAITKRWIERFVIQHQICPFARRVFEADRIRYQVILATEVEPLLMDLQSAFHLLDQQPEVATSFLIFPQQFSEFLAYLDFADLAQAFLVQQDYEGIYQLATFHPEYQFATAPANDPAHFTNRSPYAMLHLLREESIEKALLSYPDPETIPEKNIAFTRAQGWAKMQSLRDQCWKK